MGIIYKITNPSNKIYVGKTYDLRKRVNSHKYSAKKNKNLILYNSIRKYGWENHILEVIENIDDELLNEREMHWIQELNSYCQNNPMGMNMTLGGEGQRASWMHNVERRDIQSKKYAKDGNPFYNKKHTEETKKIISEKAVERNKIRNTVIPQWGIEKGRLKVMRPCIAYNNKGEFVGEYNSLTNCSKMLGLPLGSVKDSLIYGSWIRGEYMIRYRVEEDYPKNITVGEIKTKTEKREVVSIDPLGNRKTYPSALEASIELGIPKTTINRAAQYNNGKPIRNGYVFIYKK